MSHDFRCSALGIPTLGILSFEIPKFQSSWEKIGFLEAQLRLYCIFPYVKTREALSLIFDKHKSLANAFHHHVSLAPIW